MRTLVPRPRCRARALVVGVLTAGVVAVSAPPARAGGSKIYETERYSSVAQPIANWQTYEPDGTPVAKDPRCKTLPGVFRSSKVWAAVYGPPGTSLHASFRMEFHTTYDQGIAIAWRALADTQRRGVECGEVYKYRGWGNVDALKDAACRPEATARPERWCQLAGLQPRPQNALNINLNARCREPAYGGRWGLTFNHTREEFNREGKRIDRWHNLNAKFYDYEVVGGLSVPVEIDDVDFIGGVSNFNHENGQPTWGGQWIGYGNVQTAAVSEEEVRWYDDVATRMGLKPFDHPVRAYARVDQAIANNRDVPGIGRLRDVHNNRLRDYCARTPKLRDVLDPGGVASFTGIGEDLSRWIEAETDDTLCEKLQDNPQFRDFAPMGCRYNVIASVIATIDNDRCMNRSRSGTPGDPIADGFGIDLGCSKQSHIIAFFTKLKEILEG